MASKQSEIPELIRDLRGRLGLTQEKLAARLGVTYPTINRWENGRSRPSPLALRTIEDVVRSMGDDGRELLQRLAASEGRDA